MNARNPKDESQVEVPSTNLPRSSESSDEEVNTTPPFHRVTCSLNTEPLDQLPISGYAQLPEYGLYNLGLGFWVVVSFPDCQSDSASDLEAVQFGRLIHQPRQSLKEPKIKQEFTKVLQRFNKPHIIQGAAAELGYSGNQNPSSVGEFLASHLYNELQEDINTGIYLDGFYAIDCSPNGGSPHPDGQTVLILPRDLRDWSATDWEPKFEAETHFTSYSAHPYELRALDLLHGHRDLLQPDLTGVPTYDAPTVALIAALTESGCSHTEIESRVSVSPPSIPQYASHFQSVMADHDGQLPTHADGTDSESVTVTIPLAPADTETVIPRASVN